MRKPPGNRKDYKAFSTITTRWFDNDIYGHMNNAMHYQLFDTAVNGHLLEQGLLNLTDSATVYLVAETGCRYHGELAFPDVITCGLRVTGKALSVTSHERSAWTVVSPFWPYSFSVRAGPSLGVTTMRW